MKKYYVLYNSQAGNNTGKQQAEKLNEVLSGDELVFADVMEIADYAAFFAGVEEDAAIIVCGGDGTLNRFVNNTANVAVKNEIYYYACGSGNDFMRDLDGADASKPVNINEYMKNLPTVTVQGKDYKFLNGVGYGIDGYCCEVGDMLRGTTDKPINYTSIAIKGLLFHYKPTNATVIVDGVEYKYKKAWLAPTMNGRYYGGGMLPAPEQRRENDDLSVMVFYGSGKLKTLMIFPSLFKGEHVKHTKHIAVHSGHTITVKFDEPRALQIDGETILGVTEYTATK